MESSEKSVEYCALKAVLRLKISALPLRSKYS